jgi:glycosidase
MMDFPMAEAMRSALAAPPAWRAFTDVYETLSQDYVYPNPGNLVLFEGNHDIARLYSVVNENYGHWQIAIAYIMTMPRIPQLYYGTEILMTSTTGVRDDASYRHDFPGGWAGDKVNAFTGTGLGGQQKAAQEYVRKLANWRRTQPVIHRGKTMHFGAEDDTYVYFRYDGSRKVLVAFNKGDKPAVLPVARFAEMMAGVSRGTDVITGKVHDLASTLTLAPRSPLILELETNKP